MNGHDPSSQTVFSPRQPSLPGASPLARTGLVSSRTPALRAASAEPSAVRPDGLGDRRASDAHTTAPVRATPVEGERAAKPRWQDNGALGSAPQGTAQPAPGTKSARRSVLDTARDRSHNSTDSLKRSARLTLRVRPGVKTALARLAHDDKVSLSEASATGLETYARADIHDQEETLFEPRMQAMMRREIRSSDNRHVPFEIKNAIAAEQTRILTTDLYKRLLLKEGVPLKEIEKKLDTAYHLARANVLKTRTPKFQNLLVEWRRTTEDQASPRHDLSTDRHAGTTVGGEAGEDKPQA